MAGSIIMNRGGQVIHRSRNLRGLIDHARRRDTHGLRNWPVSVEVKDTDNRLAEITRELARTGQGGGDFGTTYRRYEMLVTYRNGDVGRDFFADWRVAAGWLAGKSWGLDWLDVTSDVEGFTALYRRYTTPARLRDRLPIRDDVETVQRWRKPTQREINFGHGAIHYGDFPVDDLICFTGTRIPKKWFIGRDGNRWNR